MDEQELRPYRQCLLDAGLPPAVVARHLRELRDHYEDLHGHALAAGVKAGAARHDSRTRLGALDVLANAMIAVSPRSVWHRHPVIMTIVLPVLLYGLLSVCIVAALVLVIQATSGDSGHPQALPHWLGMLASGTIVMQSHLLTPLLALMLIALGVRHHVRPAYWLPGLVLLCAVGSLSHTGLILPDATGGTDGALYMNFGSTWHAGKVLPEPADLLRFSVNVLLSAGWTWLCQIHEARRARVG